MGTRTWQMVVAAISIAVMIVVLVMYAFDDPPPTQPRATQPHVGTRHHTSPEGHEGGREAPLQVFAASTVGDWIAYRVITRSTLVSSELEGIVIAQVIAVTDAAVTVEYRANASAANRRNTWKREYPRRGLTVDQLTGNDISEWTLYNVVVDTDTRAVGGRPRRTTKLTWAARDPLFPTKTVREELWLSSEVPAGGLVEERDVQDMGSFHSEQTKLLIGYGTADAITWGERPTL